MTPPPANLHTPRIRALRDASLGYGFLPWAAGPLWELAEDYTFTLAVPGDATEYLIPAGYRFNKASIPPAFWVLGLTPDGLVTVPSLEHDFLCDLLTGASYWLRERLPGTRLLAPSASAVHHHFEIRCLQWGMPRLKARLMGGAVKLFGPGTRLRRFLQRLNPFRS